jgi:hypothetical protein
VKQVVSQKAAQCAKRLQERGFAILDGFADPAKVKQLRYEAVIVSCVGISPPTNHFPFCARFRDELDNLEVHYSPSEIWVGKGADLGAQIVVPDVRGDKVLWM